MAQSSGSTSLYRSDNGPVGGGQLKEGVYYVMQVTVCGINACTSSCVLL